MRDPLPQGTLNDIDIEKIAASLAVRLRQPGGDPVTGAAAVLTPEDPSRPLPLNADGRPEFSNVIITLDHLQDNANDGHIRNKMVFSTESAVEVIAKLMAYYRFDPDVAMSARVLEIVGEAARTEYNGGILILYVEAGNPNESPYRGPVIEVILSTVAYDELVQHPDFGKGSSLLASNEIVSAVGNVLAARREEGTGAYPVLTYLSILQADFPEASAEDAPNSTTGGQGFTDEEFR